MKLCNITKKHSLIIANEQNADNEMRNVRWPALLASLVIFLGLVCFNLLIPSMRSLPDEFGAVALAANLAGYDWSYVLTHPEKYYGSGNVFLAYPIFCFIKDPLIIYQCLLGIGAFLHALTAYIASRILIKFYREEFNNHTVIIIGIICALITPTRTSNIDNEPMLVLICWCIVYLIMSLQYSEKRKEKILYSMLLGGFLGFSYLCHTRAIMYTLIVAIVIVLYYLFTKKILISIGGFLVAVIGSYIPIISIVSEIRTRIFTNHEITTNVITNSPQALTNSIVRGVDSLFTGNGVRGLVDLFCSNLWIMYIFTGGLISLVFYFAFAETIEALKVRIKEKLLMDKHSNYFPFMYCLLGYLITLLGLCITWIDSGIGVHTLGRNLSRGHFYLRYYGNFIAPLFLFLIIYLQQNKLLISRKLINRLLLIMFIIVDYCLLSFIGKALLNYTHNLDWFYYFAPFSFSFYKWPDCNQNLFYFVIPTIVVTVCFVLLMYLSKKNIKMMLFFLLTILIWEYGYGVIMWDRPFASSENYYLAVNASYELRKNDESVFEDCNILYYNNSTYGPSYIVQFMFPDKKVITDLTLIDLSEDNIILSNKLLNSDIIDNTYSYVILDENEYLYINSENRKNKLEEKNYIIND